MLAQSLYATGGWFAAFLAFLAAAFFALRFARASATLLLVSLFFGGASFGVLRTTLMPSELPRAFAPLLDTSVMLDGKVVANPDVRETANRLTLLVERDGARTNVLAVVPLYPSVRYGDLVRVEGRLVKSVPFDTDGGRMFRYDRFLEKDGVFAIVENASLEIVAPREGMMDEMRGFFSDLKFRGIDALSAALPEPHASLASGLILGGKQGLGAELLDAFIRSGLVHIVVLSGYNVMIVAEFVMRVLGGLGKRYAALIAAAVIGGFVLAAGAGAASLRAGLMAGIALYGRATGRTYDALRALMLAALVMLMWNPLLLAYDPGFQLSFVATLGLIFGAPLVERRLLFITSRFMREIAGATIAAQIAVLPLLLYQNGLFSLIALPANLVVLPFVPVVMLASFAALLAGALFPAVAPALAFPAYALLSLIIMIVEHLSAFPLAAVSVPAFPFALALLAYALFALFIRREMKSFAKNQKEK